MHVGSLELWLGSIRYLRFTNPTGPHATRQPIED
jgi:hypothetical protein